jgi:hypothetical protein
MSLTTQDKLNEFKLQVELIQNELETLTSLNLNNTNNNTQSPQSLLQQIATCNSKILTLLQQICVQQSQLENEQIRFETIRQQQLLQDEKIKFQQQCEVYEREKLLAQQKFQFEKLQLQFQKDQIEFEQQKQHYQQHLLQPQLPAQQSAQSSSSINHPPESQALSPLSSKQLDNAETVTIPAKLLEQIIEDNEAMKYLMAKNTTEQKILSQHYQDISQKQDHLLQYESKFNQQSDDNQQTKLQVETYFNQQSEPIQGLITMTPSIQQLINMTPSLLQLVDLTPRLRQNLTRSEK